MREREVDRDGGVELAGDVGRLPRRGLRSLCWHGGRLGRNAGLFELLDALLVVVECPPFILFGLVEQLLVVLGQSLLTNLRGVSQSLRQRCFLFLHQGLQTTEATLDLLFLGSSFLLGDRGTLLLFRCDIDLFTGSDSHDRGCFVGLLRLAYRLFGLRN